MRIEDGADAMRADAGRRITEDTVAVCLQKAHLDAQWQLRLQALHGVEDQRKHAQSKLNL